MEFGGKVLSPTKYETYETRYYINLSEDEVYDIKNSLQHVLSFYDSSGIPIDSAIVKLYDEFNVMLNYNKEEVNGR